MLTAKQARSDKDGEYQKSIDVILKKHNAEKTALALYYTNKLIRSRDASREFQLQHNEELSDTKKEYEGILLKIEEEVKQLGKDKEESEFIINELLKEAGRI